MVPPCFTICRANEKLRVAILFHDFIQLANVTFRLLQTALQLLYSFLALPHVSESIPFPDVLYVAAKFQSVFYFSSSTVSHCK
jgi:hypothetical protein